MIGKFALRLLRGTLRPSVEVAAAPADIVIEWNVPVRVRNGTVLRVNVFRPRTSGAVPVIMSANPYGKDKIPAKTWSGRAPNLQARLVRQPHKMRISALTSWEARDPAFWTRHGRAVINADLRGGGTSERGRGEGAKGWPEPRARRCRRCRVSLRGSSTNLQDELGGAVKRRFSTRLRRPSRFQSDYVGGIAQNALVQPIPKPVGRHRLAE